MLALIGVLVKSLSHVRLFVTPWTVAYQAPPFMGFSRQECWSGLPFPSPGDLPDPGIEPRSSALRADALLSEPPGIGCCQIHIVNFHFVAAPLYIVTTDTKSEYFEPLLLEKQQDFNSWVTICNIFVNWCHSITIYFVNFYYNSCW